MAGKKPNWPAIESDYLAGLKPRELSRKYGVPAKTISNRASADGWGKAREEIREEIGTILPKSGKVEALADQAAEILARQLRDLEEVWGVIMGEVRDLQTTRFREVGTPAGPTQVALTPIDKLAGLKQAAGSLKDVQAGMRKALGLDDKPDDPKKGQPADGEHGVIEIPAMDEPPQPPEDDDAQSDLEA